MASGFRLQGVTLYNFKSYTGLVRIGPFTDFTTVIGTNGSGKSNLMDAISFALLVSNRKLRSAKIADLISNQADPDLTSPEYPQYACYVTLHFGNKEVYGEMDRLLELTRAIPANDARSTTVFLLDKQVVERRIYLNQLENFGFNSNEKPFMIFQNTITSFVAAEPKFFTKVIEELSGSVNYKKDYDNLKVETTEINSSMTSMATRKKDLMSQKRILGQLQKAQEKYDSNREEADRLRSKKAQVSLFYIQQRFEDAQERAEESNRQVARESAKIDELKDEKRAYDQEFQVIANEWAPVNVREHDREAQQAALKSNSDKCTSEATTAQANVDDNERIIDQYEAELKEVIAKIPAEEARHASIQSKIDEERTHGSPEQLGMASQEDLDLYYAQKAQFLRQKADLEDDHKEQTDGSNTHNLRLLQADYEETEAEIDFRTCSIDLLKKQLESWKDSCNYVYDELTVTRDQFDQSQGNLIMSGGMVQDLYRKIDDIHHENHSFWHFKMMHSQDESIRKLVQQFGKEKVLDRVPALFQPIDVEQDAHTILSVIEEHYWTIVIDNEKTLVDIYQMDFESVLGVQTFILLESLPEPEDVADGRRRLINILQYDNSDSMKKLAQHIFGKVYLLEDKTSIVLPALGSRESYASNDGLFFKPNGICFDKTFTLVDSDPEMTDDHYRKLIREELEKLTKLNEETTEQTHGWLIKEIEYKKLSREAVVSSFQEKMNALATSIGIHENDLFVKNKELTEKMQKIAAFKESERANIEKMEALAKQIQALEKELFDEILEKNDINTIEDFEIGKHARVTTQEMIIGYQSELNNAKILLDSLNNRQSTLRRNIQNWKKLLIENRFTLNAKNANLAKQSQEQIDQLAMLEEERRKNADIRDRYEAGKKRKQELDDKLSKAKKAVSSLKSTQRIIQNSINQLKAERHSLYEKIYIESIPFDFQNGRQEFMQVFEDQEDKTLEDLYGEEEQLVPIFSDFRSLSRQLAGDNAKIQQKLAEFDQQIDCLCTEMRKCQLADEDELRENIKKNEQSIKAVTRQLAAKREEQKVKNREYENVKKFRSEMFNNFLHNVSEAFEAIYKELTNKESAQTFLHCENADEPYLAGVRLSVIAPNKQFQDMSLLSCGEKTLIAFAFIFSLYSEKFPTFFMIDEIDGSVDNNNLKLLSQFLDKKSTSTQFIVITHRTKMMESCLSAIGVRLENNNANDSVTSKALALDLRPYRRY